MVIRTPLTIAGPCAVESPEQVDRIAAGLAAAGTRWMRGGAFKPRTHPETFQGLGWPGLRILEAAARRHGLGVVSEVLRVEDVEPALAYVDVLQIGARSMYNVALLREAARVFRTVLLKRHFGATVEDVRGALAYMRRVDPGLTIVVCERGIRTFSDAGRFTLDLSAALALKAEGERVIVDPSHAAGVAWQVPALARAALAAGLDGVIVEVHDEPDRALCDAAQAVTIEQWRGIVDFARQLEGMNNGGTESKERQPNASSQPRAARTDC